MMAPAMPDGADETPGGPPSGRSGPAAPTDRQRWAGPLTITDRELFARLGWFTHVRWAFGVFCLLMLLLSWHVLDVRFRVADGQRTMGPAVEVVLVIFLYNALFTFVVRMIRDRQRITRRLIEGLALAQVMCDLAALTALAHFTGGVDNHFVLLILVPIVIVSELLPRPLAFAAAAAAVGLFNLLAWGEQQGWIPHVHVESAGGRPGPLANLYAQPAHVLHVTAAVSATVFAAVFVATTIAARLRAREGELENAYRQLHRTDEAKGFFMRRAEHEIRAPLAAIQSILDAIAAEPETLSDAQRRRLRRAKARSQALRELVGDLRRYSRLRADQQLFQTRTVCFSDVVIDTVDLFAKQAEARGVALASAVSPTWLEGNEEMLRELVTNLVSNAVQYTPAGGRIDAALQRYGDVAALHVADTGIGLSDEAAGRLFEEFYRAPQAKEVFPDGTGLGLAIVRRIVEAHHGSIDARRRPEGGTIFTVLLPNATGPDDTEPA
jgi:signal transduction histidine kinase